MTPRVQFDPSKHPRGPIGRFIDAGGDGAAWAPNPRLSNAQSGIRAWENLGTNGAAIDNAYKRGAMFDGPKIAHQPERFKDRMESYIEASSVNEHLREGRMPPNVPDQWTVETLDTVIDEMSLNRDTTVYRSIRDPEWLAEAQPGDQIIDRGFMSTTMNPAVAADYGDAMMEVDLPKGTHAMPISKAAPSEYNWMTEVVVGRGSVIEIVGIDEARDGARLIRARLVGYMED